MRYFGKHKCEISKFEIKIILFITQFHLKYTRLSGVRTTLAVYMAIIVLLISSLRVHTYNVFINTFVRRKLLLSVKYSINLNNNDKHIWSCDVTGSQLQIHIAVQWRLKTYKITFSKNWGGGTFGWVSTRPVPPGLTLSRAILIS